MNLFVGLDYRVVTGTLEDTRSLTNEVWRTFPRLHGAGDSGEALLCLPARRTKAGAETRAACGCRRG